MQDALPYTEPPFWYYPIRQSLGATLLMAGRAEEAESVLMQSLINYPNNGWALYGLREALAAQNDKAGANEMDKLFKNAWAGDVDWINLNRL